METKHWFPKRFLSLWSNLFKDPLDVVQVMEEQKISSGCSIIDDLLDGGYETDAITTVYGGAGVGKTNLALLAAVSVAQQGKKVIFIDTEGGFSVTRLKQVVKDHKKVLERILFLKPTNFGEQCKVFDKLKSLVNQKIGLIVVDTISMLYRLERKLGEDSHEFNHELSRQVACLTEISRKKNIPIFLTNQVYTGFDTGKMHMVGGDILKYSSKVLIEVQALNNGVRKATLKKHRSISVDKEVFFRIVETGLENIKRQE